MFLVPPSPFRSRVLSAAGPGLVPHTKQLDWQGGEFPVVNCRNLVAADFITYPEEVEGSNCGNCRFNNKGKCSFFDKDKGIDLRGQPVTSRNCCGEWDAPGTLRLGRNACDGPQGKSLQPVTTALPPPRAAGIAVVAEDTGRVLMVQRGIDDDSGHGGQWELPGGKIDKGETAVQAATREWQEETGMRLPEHHYSQDGKGEWRSSNGTYQGFVLRVPSESVFDLAARDLNSNPDGDQFEVVAWVHPDDFKHHNLRDELHEDATLVKKAIKSTEVKAETKAMSAYNLTTGGALVGAKLPKKMKAADKGDLRRALNRVGEELANRREPPQAMPGYGQIFLNSDDTGGRAARVWYVGGDGDDDGFGELVEEKVREAFPGLSDDGFTYEAEAFPPKSEPGWVKVYPIKSIRDYPRKGLDLSFVKAMCKPGQTQAQTGCTPKHKWPYKPAKPGYYHQGKYPGYYAGQYEQNVYNKQHVDPGLITGPNMPVSWVQVRAKLKSGQGLSAYEISQLPAMLKKVGNKSILSLLKHVTGKLTVPTFAGGDTPLKHQYIQALIDFAKDKMMLGKSGRASAAQSGQMTDDQAEKLQAKIDKAESQEVLPSVAPTAPTGQASGEGKSETSPVPEEKGVGKAAVVNLGHMTWESIKNLPNSAAAYETAAKEWVENKLGQNVARLPTEIQPLVRGAWLAARMWTKKSFATYKAGQTLAEQVAGQAGGDEGSLKRLKAIVSAVDVGTQKPIRLAGEKGPSGSLAYLMHSSAVNPLGVLRGAQKVVSLAAEHHALPPSKPGDVAALLAEASQFVGDDDGRMAVLLVALDRTQDLGKAVTLAKGGQMPQAAGGGTKALCKPGQTVEQTNCTPVSHRPSPPRPYGSTSATAPSGPPKPSTAPAGGTHVGINRQPSFAGERGHGNPPPKLIYQSPPPMKGEIGVGRVGGLAAVCASPAFADAMEGLITDLGFRSLGKGSPLEVEWDDSGYAFEIKVVTTNAAEYRAVPRTGRMEETQAFARQNDLKPGTILGVADCEKGLTHFYWREGVGAFRLSDGGETQWNYLGTAKVPVAGEGKKSLPFSRSPFASRSPYYKDNPQGRSVVPGSGAGDNPGNGQSERGTVVGFGGAVSSDPGPVGPESGDGETAKIDEEFQPRSPWVSPFKGRKKL